MKVRREIPSDVLPEGQNGASEASQEAAAAQASPSELSGPPKIPAAAAGEHAGAARTVNPMLFRQPRKRRYSSTKKEKFCPGHVDLTITARITGLSERKNLFTLDKRAT